MHIKHQEPMRGEVEERKKENQNTHDEYCSLNWNDIVWCEVRRIGYWQRNKIKYIAQAPKIYEDYYFTSYTWQLSRLNPLHILHWVVFRDFDLKNNGIFCLSMINICYFQEPKWN